MAGANVVEFTDTNFKSEVLDASRYYVILPDAVGTLLVEVARDHGADSHLIDNETQVEEEWLEGKRVVGISSGASAPEELVQRLVEFFRARGTSEVYEFEVVQEDVRFMLPREIRRALAAQA